MPIFRDSQKSPWVRAYRHVGFWQEMLTEDGADVSAGSPVLFWIIFWLEEDSPSTHADL